MALLSGDIKLDIIAVLITIITTIYLYFQWNFQYWKKRNVPYLEPSIPFGSLKPTYKQTMGQSLAEQYKTVKAKGWKFCGIYQFSKPTLFITDLEVLKHILTKDFNHFDDRGFYVNEENENITGNLFSIGGSKWRKIRKELTPTFTSGKMKQMFQILEDCSVWLEKYIEEVAEKKAPVDIRQGLACFTTDVIGSCAFGLECNSFKNADHPFVKYGRKVIELTTVGAMKQFFTLNYPNVAKFFNMRFFPKDCSNFYNDVVTKTVEYREKNNVQRNDFLQILMDIKNNKKAIRDSDTGLTMDEVIAQSFVFFIGGFETSSTTMTYAMFELAQHPEIQDRVREEIHSVLKKYNGKITYDALKDMKYLGQIIDETLRIYPPLGFLTRECTMDYKIPDSDVVIEKGTGIIFSVNGIQNDEEYYENPTVFNPDRFSEEMKKNRNPYTFLAFGEGPRLCIGMRFGLTQTKMGLATILENHTISLSSKTQVPLKMKTSSPIIPVAEGGIWIDIQKI